jgi:hypothetical protein
MENGKRRKIKTLLFRKVIYDKGIIWDYCVEREVSALVQNVKFKLSNLSHEFIIMNS